MNLPRFPRALFSLFSLASITLLAACGGSPSGSATDSVEAHVVAAETLGVTLADIRTQADFDQAKSDLLRQARAVAETQRSMVRAVLDNDRLSETDKAAAIEPFQMRLAGAERLWREELQRLSVTLGEPVVRDLRAVVMESP